MQLCNYLPAGLRSCASIPTHPCYLSFRDRIHTEQNRRDFWFAFLFTVPCFGKFEMAAPQISSAYVLDPSQMVSRNYIVRHVKEMLAKYAVAFTSNMNPGQLFELLRFHCVVNYDREIILNPATFTRCDWSMDIVKALFHKYEVQCTETYFEDLYNQLFQYCVANFKEADYPRSLYINPFGFSSRNYTKVAHLRSELAFKIFPICRMTRTKACSQYYKPGFLMTRETSSITRLPQMMQLVWAQIWEVPHPVEINTQP